MQLKKNWLYYGNLLFFIILMAYIMFSGIGSFSEGEEYAYLYRGILIAALFFSWLFMQGIVKLVLWIKENTGSGSVKRKGLMEAAAVCFIFAVGIALRYLMVSSGAFEIPEDFSNIFQSADCIMRGTLWTEGKIYCSYLSVFPQYFLYTLVLAGVFSVFGSSIFAAAMVQLFFSGCVLLLIYGIAKSLGGIETGLGALFFTAVSPVLILKQNQLSVLSFNTTFLLLSVWMFLIIMRQRIEEEKISNTIIMHVLLGIFLAVTIFLIPAAVILLPVLVLVLIFMIGYEDVEQRRTGLLFQILFSVLMLVVCISGILGIKIGTGIFIGKELPSFVHQGGYEMLTSLNIDYNGQQNEEDELIKENILMKTGSADEVHRICKNLAYTRFGQNVMGSINLLVKKMNRIWGVSPNENVIFYWLQNYYYFMGILFSILFALHLWQKGPSERILLLAVINVMALVLVWFIGEYEISQMLAPVFSVMAAIEVYALYSDKKMVYSLIWREEKLRAEEESGWLDELGEAVKGQEPCKAELKEEKSLKAEQEDEERKKLEELLEKEMLFDFAMLEGAEERQPDRFVQEQEIPDSRQQKKEKKEKEENLTLNEVFYHKVKKDGEDRENFNLETDASISSKKSETEKKAETEAENRVTKVVFEEVKKMEEQEKEPEDRISIAPEPEKGPGIESTKALRSVEEEAAQKEIKELKSHLRSVLEEEDAKEKAARVKELLEIQNEIDSMIQVIESSRQNTVQNTEEDQREKHRQQIEKAKEMQRKKARQTDKPQTSQTKRRPAERMEKSAVEVRQLQKIFGPSADRRVPERIPRTSREGREPARPVRNTSKDRMTDRGGRSETEIRFSETGKLPEKKPRTVSEKKRRQEKAVQNSFIKL